MIEHEKHALLPEPEDRQPGPEPVARAEPEPAAEPVAEPAVKAESPGLPLDPGIFRAYDIRGVVGQSLDQSVARRIGQAVGSLAVEREAERVMVARDGRLSGPDLIAGLVEGLVSTGCEVVDVGAVPTPVLYYAAHEFGSGSGVMVTGSHNPPDYNGFKIMVAGETLSDKAIQALYQRLQDNNILRGEGSFKEQNVLSSYCERIGTDVQLERPLKIVADCGNGIAGVIAPRVLEAIGAEVVPLYAEVDGTFPNHHPDPSEPKNLEDLKICVKNFAADLGVAFDGDGDRLGVVTAEGEVIYPDRLLMLYARDVISRNPDMPIIYDVKCTGHLGRVIEESGGIPLMWKTGHSLIKRKMKQENAPLAGEMSGHFFFKERWYGFDDGIYACARLLEILAADKSSPTAVLKALPDSVSTPELKIHMQEGESKPFISEFQKQAGFEGAEVSTIDGVRADFPDGWGLIRSSNTTPVLVLRFDADNEQALERIKDLFRSQILALNPDLELPF